MVARFEGEDRQTKIQWINAFIQVRDFRTKNPKIIRLWKKYGNQFDGVEAGGDYSLDIADGRTLKFWNIREERGGRTAKPTQGGKRREKYYGALIFQNEIQALARSIFSGHLVTLSEMGYDVILQVHDELVLEVEEDKVNQACIDTQNTMRTTPEWCDCPIDCEYAVVKCYTK